MGSRVLAQQNWPEKRGGCLRGRPGEHAHWNTYQNLEHTKATHHRHHMPTHTRHHTTQTLANWPKSNWSKSFKIFGPQDVGLSGIGLSRIGVSRTNCPKSNWPNSAIGPSRISPSRTALSRASSRQQVRQQVRQLVRLKTSHTSPQQSAREPAARARPRQDIARLHRLLWFNCLHGQHLDLVPSPPLLLFLVPPLPAKDLELALGGSVPTFLLARRCLW